MNDYDTPEIRCSLRNLSRVTECPSTNSEVNSWIMLRVSLKNCDFEKKIFKLMLQSARHYLDICSLYVTLASLEHENVSIHCNITDVWVFWWTSCWPALLGLWYWRLWGKWSVFLQWLSRTTVWKMQRRTSEKSRHPNPWNCALPIPQTTEQELFLWRNANTIPHGTLISFVKNAKFQYAWNVSKKSIRATILMSLKISMQKNMPYGKVNFQKSKNTVYRQHKTWKPKLKKMSQKSRK